MTLQMCEVRAPLTLLSDDELPRHVFGHDGVGQVAQKLLQHARHRHDVASVTEVGVARLVERRLDALNDARVPINPEHAFMVQP